MNWVFCHRVLFMLFPHSHASGMTWTLNFRIMSWLFDHWYAKCCSFCYGECRCAKYHHGECRYAARHGAMKACNYAEKKLFIVCPDIDGIKKCKRPLGATVFGKMTPITTTIEQGFLLVWAFVVLLMVIILNGIMLSYITLMVNVILMSIAVLRVAMLKAVILIVERSLD